MAENFNTFLKDLEKTLPELTKETADAVGGKGGMIYGILQGFTNIIVGFVATFLPGIVKIIPAGLTAATDHVKEKYMEGFTKNADALLDVIKAYGLIDDSGADALNKITRTFGIFQAPLLLVSIVMIVVDYMKGIMQASMGKIMQQYNSAYSPYALDASSAARAAFIAPEKYDEAHEALRRNGLSDDDISLLYLSMYKTHDTDTVRELYLRGLFLPDKAKSELRKQGYTDDRIDELIETWYPIPAPNDLITMAVREAFSESQAASLGLDYNLPSAFVEWASKQGISAQWAKMYWRAHWQLPSPQMGYEMVHRGLITEDDLRGLLVALDYSPRWHDALMGINYNLMTRVDLRRIFELGLINADEMEQKYREIGYSPGDAKLLRAWTEVEYNQEYKDITKTEIINQYLEGIIDEDKMRDMLLYMGYTSERIETMVALAQYKRAYAKQTTLIAALKKMYISGQIAMSHVQSELSLYNIDARRIVELVDQWDIEKLAEIKLPMKTELDQWFLADVISRGDYITEMNRIGYSDKNIERYVKWIELQKGKKSNE